MGNLDYLLLSFHEIGLQAWAEGPINLESGGTFNQKERMWHEATPSLFLYVKCK